MNRRTLRSQLLIALGDIGTPKCPSFAWSAGLTAVQMRSSAERLMSGCRTAAIKNIASRAGYCSPAKCIVQPLSLKPIDFFARDQQRAEDHK